MLVRFVVNNLLSFGEQKEFNTLPNNRIKSLNHHKVKFNDFSLLKMTSLYGANGAGKSNLIKALNYMKMLVKDSEDFPRLSNHTFKFNSDLDPKNQILAIEFIENGKAFYYGLEVVDNIIRNEELYSSGLGKGEDKLIYHRSTELDKTSKIKFFEEFEAEERNKVLKDVLIKDFVKPNKPILRLLSRRDNTLLTEVKEAYNWFNKTLQILSPDSKPIGLAQNFEFDPFKEYSNSLINSLSLGIKSIQLEKDLAENVLEDEELLEKLMSEFEKETEEDELKKAIILRDDKSRDFVITKEDGELWIKGIQVEHEGKSNKRVLFDLEDESDGTVRLIDFVPAFHEIISTDCVYVIDEIERSIHPLLIKELIKKFSLDKRTKGQLIFTTHESNLLDLDILRQDEIWFVEKDINGSTDFYPLSDFKEHKSIDIRKGYLNGRYGSIPFLANLKDLNWHIDDIKE